MEVFRIDEFEEEVVSQKLKEIYERTTDRLWFSTSLHPDFFNREDIRERIESLCEEGVEIRILLDEDVDANERDEPVEWVFELECAEIKQSTQDISHRVISDGKHLRLEKDHAIQTKGGANLIAIDAEGPFAEAYENQFEDWWGNGTNV